jgi:hypothetical protein
VCGVQPEGDGGRGVLKRAQRLSFHVWLLVLGDEHIAQEFRGLCVVG